MQVVEQIHQAAIIIRKGGIVAFPTETCYGLAVDPFNEAALEKLYSLKKRSHDKPFLLLVDCKEQLEKCIRDIPSAYSSLMAQYWPGPLTLIFPVNDELPQLLSKDGGVAIRHTSGVIALSLLKECGIPLTATSANISGMPPALSGNACREMFQELDVYVIDDSNLSIGQFSTMISTIGGKLTVIREGSLDISETIDAINKGSL